MVFWHFIQRLWKHDKLLLVSLVLMAGLVYPMVTWAINDYPDRGWLVLFYPAFMVYGFVRILLVARRSVDRAEGAVVDQDQRMEKVFRKGSQQDFDALVMEEGARQEAERAKLWADAVSSPRAARQLRQAIRDELQALDDIMRYMVKETPHDTAGIQDIAMRRKEVEQELARVATLDGHTPTQLPQ